MRKPIEVFGLDPTPEEWEVLRGFLEYAPDYTPAEFVRVAKGYERRKAIVMLAFIRTVARQGERIAELEVRVAALDAAKEVSGDA